MEVPASENEELPNARTIFQALQEQHQKQFEHIHEVVSKNCLLALSPR